MVYDKTISKQHLDAIKRTSKKLMKLIEKYENSDENNDYNELSINKLNLKNFISEIQLKEVLSGFSQNKNSIVLEYIAKNQYTPPEKLKEIEKQNTYNYFIKKNIESNPSTPVETIEKLKTKGYVKYIESNPSTPVETIEKYNNKYNNKKLLRKLIRKVCLRN